MERKNFFFLAICKVFQIKERSRSATTGKKVLSKGGAKDWVASLLPEEKLPSLRVGME